MSSSHSSSESLEAIAHARRDLAWAIASPPLWGKHPPLFERWARQPLDLQAANLVDIKLASSRRVPIGRYFERLVQRWLETREDVSKLTCNLPIRSQNATLGEVDLLFEAQGRCYHWELALKFYLGVGDRLTAAQWYGPQGRDRLDLKLDKLDSQQLRLLETEEGKAALGELGLANPESHSLIKGYLFHPFADWVHGRRPVPPGVHREHAHGYWIHLSKVQAIAARSSHWRCLAKPEWLASACGTGTIAAADLSAWLHSFFAHDDRPPIMVAVDGNGQEQERCFVVPDHWQPAPK